MTYLPDHASAFRDLAVGDTFDFVNDAHPELTSFYTRCVKTSTRTYEPVDNAQAKLTYRVGSVHVIVYHVEARS